MTEEQKNATDTGEQVSASTAPVTTENESSAKGTDPVDEKIKQVIGEHNLPAPEETEEKPEDKKGATDPNKKEEEVPEKKEGEEFDGKTEEASEEFEGPQPEKLDRRIAKLYLQARLLRGEEGDAPDLEEVAREIQRYPFGEKKKALHKLLAEVKNLREGGNNDEGSVDLSEEDHEAIVEAEANRRLAEMRGEIEQREWAEDLVKTVEAHPELDERKQEYNVKLATAVENLVKRGMKTSEAYKLVTDSISVAKEEKKKDDEIEKQKALSGAVSASTDHVETQKKLTWDELAEIQAKDPARYMEIMRSGELPE